MATAPNLLIVGDGPVTDALMAFVTILGWPVTVTTQARTVGPEIDAVVITSHQDGVDAPTIQSALTAGTAYVGAMGSRRTQTRRREWLLGAGVTEQALEALHAPIGLDIGADQPAEIALSILARIIAVRNGGAAPVHRGGDPADAGGQASGSPGLAIDPICGMTVAAVAGTPSLTRDGETIYFCCDRCKSKYEAQHGHARLAD